MARGVGVWVSGGEAWEGVALGETGAGVSTALALGVSTLVRVAVTEGWGVGVAEVEGPEPAGATVPEAGGVALAVLDVHAATTSNTTVRPTLHRARRELRRVIRLTPMTACWQLNYERPGAPWIARSAPEVPPRSAKMSTQACLSSLWRTPDGARVRA